MRELIDNYKITHLIMKFNHFSKSSYSISIINNIFACGNKTLDIGVGRGEMLSCMSEWSCDYLGIDISLSTVNHCQSLNLKALHVSDIKMFLESNDNKYDVVTMLDVLEHIPKNEVISILSNIRNRLTKNGKLIIQVPNLQAPFGYLHHFNDFTHFSGFVEHSLSQVVKASGFKRTVFYPFEETVDKSFRYLLKKQLREIYWLVIRVLRWLNNSPNPKILTPVFYCVASDS